MQLALSPTKLMPCEAGALEMEGGACEGISTIEGTDGSLGAAPHVDDDPFDWAAVQVGDQSNNEVM